MNSVLTSIQPKWCELIANGSKTIEVRKTKPREKPPFKVYMYMSKDAKKHYYIDEYGDMQVELIPKKIIGEFVCDNIIEYPYDYCDGTDIDDDSLLETQLEREDINIYAKGKTIYGWHISDIVIYDKPRELSDFATLCKGTGSARNKTCKNCWYLCFDGDPINGYTRFCGANKRKTLTRPPQSWCYVEKRE